jgi:hypothetical protein
VHDAPPAASYPRDKNREGSRWFRDERNISGRLKFLPEDPQNVEKFATFGWQDWSDRPSKEVLDRMRVPLVIVFVAVSGLVGCQAPLATLETAMSEDPAKLYLGMTKAEIIACAGAPASTYAHHTGETLVYRYSGAGPVPGAEKKKEEKEGSPFSRKKSDKKWTCSASLVFEGGKLARLTFAHKDVVSPYEQKKDPKTGEKTYVTPPPPCAFSLPNCRRG